MLGRRSNSWNSFLRWWVSSFFPITCCLVWCSVDATNSSLRCSSFNGQGTSFELEGVRFTHDQALPRQLPYEVECFRLPGGEQVCLPSWIITASGKSGSSALWNFLCQDPTHHCKRKELHYKGQPLLPYMRQMLGQSARKASGNMNYDLGQELESFILHSTCVKFLVLLRNPVDWVYAAWHFWCNKLDGKNCSHTAWVSKTEGAMKRTPENFHSIVTRYCMSAGPNQSKPVERWGNSSCPLRWPWAQWRTALKLKSYLTEKVLVLRTENLHEHPARIMRQVYRFLELPLSGFQRKVENFQVSYNTGLVNGAKKNSSHDQALGASYQPMLPETRVILKKLLMHDEKLKYFVEHLGIQYVAQDIF